MIDIRRAALMLILVSGSWWVSGCQTGQQPTLALRDVTVIDVSTGTLSPGQTVLIAGERIVDAGPADRIPIPEGVQVVAEGGYLLPGLIDMHVHALWDRGVSSTFPPLFVANGVTTVRDMGGTLEVLREHRDSASAPSFPGPRTIAAGMILDGPEPVHPDISIPVSTPEEAVAAVDSVAAAGADFIKVYTLLPARAFAAVMTAAEVRGLAVAGHVPYEVGPISAAAAGLWTIEHLVSEVGGFCDPDDPGSCASAVAAFRQYRTWHVPTLVALTDADADELCGDERLRYLPSAVRDYWFGGELPQGCMPTPGNPVRYEPALPEESRLVRLLDEADVALLAGTDAGVPFVLPGWSLHDELSLLVDAGLSPGEALRAATYDAARALGRDHELGLVRRGYLADMVLLTANPLENIRHSAAIQGVVLNGRWLNRDSLDAMLEAVAGAVDGQRSPRALQSSTHADSARLALEGDGLRAFLVSTGAARPMPFGTPAADALSFLTTVLAARPLEQGENVECALEYATWQNGLTAWFANDVFAGWSVARDSRLTTVNGIGPGSTRDELHASYDVVIAPSSLGVEFTAGGMAGLLDSEAPDARVLHLWAGQVCIAR